VQVRIVKKVKSMRTCKSRDEKYQFYKFVLGIFLTVPIPQTYAQNTSSFHNDVDTSPIEAVIMINENGNKTAYFESNTITVRVGGEILIASMALQNMLP
jgi:hypothetical protein